MIDAIVHPSDFSPTSYIAFIHALKLALAFNVDLRMFHVAGHATSGHHGKFPSVRETLENWQVLPPGSRRSSVGKLGIDVEKIVVHRDNVVQAISEYLYENPAGLLALASHRHENRLWFDHSRAEPIARNAATTALFVPDGCNGFIDSATGLATLRNIVVPVAETPSPSLAIRLALKFADVLQCPQASIRLIHFGSTNPSALAATRDDSRVSLTLSVAVTNIATGILNFAHQANAELIVMPTEGRHGFLDAILGSTIEQVLRETRCPLLAITI